jgi:hypothetical protein
MTNWSYCEGEGIMKQHDYEEKLGMVKESLRHKTTKLAYDLFVAPLTISDNATPTIVANNKNVRDLLLGETEFGQNFQEEVNRVFGEGQWKVVTRKNP